GHTAAITSVTFAADGTLWSVSLDRTVRQWDVHRNTELAKFDGPAGIDVAHVQLAPGGRLAEWRLRDGSLHVWDVAGGKELSAVTRPAVQGHAVHAEAKLAVTGDGRGIVRFWSTTTGEKRGEVRVHPDGKAVNVIAFSPDGRNYAVAAGDRVSAGNVGTVLDPAFRDTPRPEAGRPGVTRTEIVRFEGHTNRVSRAVFLDNRRILTASPDNTIRLWDTEGKETGRLDWTPRRFGGDVYALGFADEGQRLLSATHDGMRLWDLASRRELPRFPLGNATVLAAAAFSPDGRRAYSSPGQGLVVWDVATGKEVKTVPEFETIHGLGISPDGQRALCVGDGNNTVALWDLTTWRLLRRLQGHGSQVCAFAFAPDGRRALTASLDRTVRLWDLETGKQIRELVGGDMECGAVAISLDGRLGLTGSTDHIIRLWDLETGRPLHRFEGHTAEVSSVAFSPDGRRILSASKDKTARLWEMPK
ncbi:MAG TPA: WD40 repeat domain-containing protein, partial [Gemmataceae bacterium]|nr:WD40 repeat domain-containing protein [Gemmataceae bacterium]